MSIYLGKNRVSISGTKILLVEKKYSLGINNLKLDSNFNHEIFDMQIYGNSLQDGIPTLDVPIEIQSVGDRTKNLFNKNAATKGVALVTTTGGTYNTSNYFTTDYISISVGKRYSFNWKTNKWYCFYDENKNYLGYGSSPYYFNNSEASFVRFSVDISELDTFQVEQNESSTEYEPYGYKIPIVISKNLFRALTLEQGTAADANGVLADSTTRVRTNFFSLEAGRYNLTLNWATNKVMVKGVHIYNEEGEWQKYLAFSSSNVNFSITERSKVMIIFNKSANAEIIPEDVIGSDVKFWLGETMEEDITTNIYLNEPLRKIGDYADYIDYKNKKVVRNIEVIDNSGTLTIEESLKTLQTPTEEIIYIPSIYIVKGLAVFTINTGIAPSETKITYLKHI